MNKYNKKNICDISKSLGKTLIPIDWQGIDSVIELIEEMKSDGAVIIIKFDGERKKDVDNGSYTFIVTGKPLNDESIRIDTASIEHGLSFIIGEYAKMVWHI